MYKDVIDIELNETIKQMQLDGKVLTDIHVLNRESYRRLYNGTVSSSASTLYRLFYKEEK